MVDGKNLETTGTYDIHIESTLQEKMQIAVVGTDESRACNSDTWDYLTTEVFTRDNNTI